MGVLMMVENKPLVSIPVIISKKNGMPLIELRKSITNMDIIRTLVSCAFHEIPIIILPQFTNKIDSLNSLQEKGIIYKDIENGKEVYKFAL